MLCERKREKECVSGVGRGWELEGKGEKESRGKLGEIVERVLWINACCCHGAESQNRLQPISTWISISVNVSPMNALGQVDSISNIMWQALWLP